MFAIAAMFLFLAMSANGHSDVGVIIFIAAFFAALLRR